MLATLTRASREQGRPGPSDYHRGHFSERAVLSLAKRLGSVARSGLQGGRELVGDPSDGGAETLYARILDGRHLWLAVPAELGRPLLWDEQARREVVVENLDGEDHPEYASVRWLLEDALADGENAELLVAAAAGDGTPVPLHLPPPPPTGSLRVPPTPDRRWRFVLPASEDGLLRVRRTRAVAVAVLEEISTVGASVRIVVTSDQEGDVRLLFLEEGRLAHDLPMTREGARLVVTLGEHDLPAVTGGYGLWVGTPEEHRPVVRRNNDLLVGDADDVLLPLVLGAQDDGMVAGRFRFNSQGALRVARRADQDGRAPRASA
jgi:hypothetical protein